VVALRRRRPFRGMINGRVTRWVLRTARPTDGLPMGALAHYERDVAVRSYIVDLAQIIEDHRPTLRFRWTSKNHKVTR